MTEQIILKTDFKDLKLFRRGKVRDVYDLGDELLIVSTDRISAFDVIVPNGIPNKGRVLTALSFFWFDLIKDIVPNHLITADVDKYPVEVQKYKEQIAFSIGLGNLDFLRTNQLCRFSPASLTNSTYSAGKCSAF